MHRGTQRSSRKIFGYFLILKMKNIGLIGYILVIVGALNWGLVGLGWLAGAQDWNLVHMILGSMPQVEALVYVLVGAAGVWMLINRKSA